MKKYVSNFEQLEKEDIQSIKDACDIILKYMEMQEETLREADQE